MAYYVNGKTYTDHPLMDEMCYNCKKILNGIVIKNDVLANNSETEHSIIEAEKFIVYKEDGYIPFDVFPFDEEILSAFGYEGHVIHEIIHEKDGKERIPHEDRTRLTNFANNYFLEHFEEENNYYRMLMGIPPFDTGEEYFIYLTEDDIPSRYISPVDFSLPLHKQPKKLIRVLYIEGVIDKLRRNTYVGSNYSYMNFLGNRSIDLYKARKAAKWDILYMPDVYYLIEDRFTDVYKINRDWYTNKVYQEFFAQVGDYYDQMMILMVLAETFNDMIVEIPEWYIRRDIFDLRSCQYFLESYGVTYFKEIPLKYQIRIVKNINKLIKYKSSNKNFDDIIEIFALTDDVKIHKYWLFKNRVKKEIEHEEPIPEPEPDIIEDIDYNFGDIDSTIDVLIEGDHNFGDLDYNDWETSIPDKFDLDCGDEDYNLVMQEIRDRYSDKLQEEASEQKEDGFVVSEDPNEMYKLEFIASKVGDSFDNYIKDNRYRTPYDDITYADKYWDGEDTHSHIKTEILNQEFTIRGTKYMSIEYEVNLSEYLYQITYFMGLVLDSNINCDDMIISIPSLDELSEFRLVDLFLFLIILTNSFNRESIKDGFTGVRLADVYSGSPLVYDENFYDWKMKYLPEIYQVKHGRVYAFNSRLSKDNLMEFMSRRHSHFRFGAGDYGFDPPKNDAEYKKVTDAGMKELMIPDYIVPFGGYEKIEDLITIYRNNTKVYNKVKEAIIMANNADDKKSLLYIFQELFTRDEDHAMYWLESESRYATTLDEILKERDYVLYNLYIDIMSEGNLSSRQDYIRSVMSDIVDTLEYYISGPGLNYVFAFTSTESFYSMVYYLYLMIGFFKSFKVHFLDPYVTFISNDFIENNAKGADNIRELKKEYTKWDKAFITDDLAGINKNFNAIDEGLIPKFFEYVDIYAHHINDPLLDQDYDGKNAADGEEDGYYDADGRYSDDTSTYPYITINGGSSSEGRVDLSNIDGGQANELSREYFDVDCGYAYDPDCRKTDAMGSQMFNYEIDGGAAAKRRFRTNTVAIDFIGTEFLLNAVISNKAGNPLIIKPDGLFVDKNAYINTVDFDRYIASISNIIELTKSHGSIYLEIIEMSSDINLIHNVVDRILSTMVYSIREVAANMENNKFYNEMISYVSLLIPRLIGELQGTLQPFEWVDL